MIRIASARQSPEPPAVEPDLARAQLSAFCRQVPVLFGTFGVNALLLGASHIHTSPLALSVVFPVILSICFAIRGRVWFRRGRCDMTGTEAALLLATSRRLIVPTGVVLTAWALALCCFGGPEARFQMILYLTVTTISSIFCLTHMRGAALLLVAVFMTPLLILLLTMRSVVSLATAASLLVVMAGMILVLLRHHADFASLVRSQRELIARQVETRRLGDENLRLANLDAVTGLPNRRSFLSSLDQLLAERAPSRGRLAVALIDLDGFKRINDVYGHMVGDRLLIEVGERLRTQAGFLVSAARLGGDEFGAILTGDPSDDAILEFGQAVSQALRLPFLQPHFAIELSGSIGLVAYPDGAETAAQLFERADAALYYAKQSPGGVVIFSHEHERAMREQTLIERALRHDDLSEQMQLAYQPIYDAGTRTTTGFEALARWTSPSLGTIAPGIFIPIAERSRLTRRLTCMLLRQALADVASWPADLSVSFNLSAQDLTAVETMHEVQRIVLNSAVAPSRIHIEITETAIMQDCGKADEGLSILRQLGVRISLDDFGTGFSSLSHVHRLKPDRIKIDRSFVIDIETNSTSRDIVVSVVQLCRALGIGCVVEGVETEAQRQILLTLGCRLMQGYLFGRPTFEPLLTVAPTITAAA